MSDRLVGDGLEQLDDVSGWIVEQDLVTSFALSDFAAELQARSAEAFDLGHQIGDVDLEAAPAARFLLTTIGHGGRAFAGGCADKQPHGAAIQSGKRR